MKNWVLVLILLSCSGCASVSIPNYIQDKNPYKKVFYSSYDQILSATKKTLTDFGWVVSGSSDPSVFEREAASPQNVPKQVLLFTDIRQTSLVVGTRYARMNAYVRAIDEKSAEVEFRYVTISSMSVKNFYNYRKDHLIDRMFKHVGQLVK